MFDGQDAGAPLPDLGGDLGMGEKKSFFQRIFSKSETVIPIILIVILLLILVLAFSGWDYSNIPLVGGALKSVFGAKQYNVLIIGNPSPVSMDYIIGNPDFTKTYKFSLPMAEDSFTRNPEERLKTYDFIILDQSDSGTPYGLNKAIPYQLAEALKAYVAGGKSLIIVGNSAHRLAGNPDAYGWKAIFGDMVPGDCQANISMESPCETPLPVLGIFENTYVNNTLFEGIDQIPSQSDRLNGTPGLNVTLYPVNHNGQEWFSIKEVRNPAHNYPAIIVNKSMLGGKIVQITFGEWGLIPNVMHRVFEYVQ